MGIGPNICSSASEEYSSVNPDPKNYVILSLWHFDKAYVLRVNYPDCTNFEGDKIMVFKGEYHNNHNDKVKYLDPHFTLANPNLIARFAPTKEGLDLALKMAGEIE